jgi:hypothetical protein
VHSIKPILMALAGVTLLSPAAPQLATTDAVLEKYQQALGGVDAVKNVQSQTVRGTVENSGGQPAAKFVYYAKPFKTLFKVTRPDGKESVFGFDGATSWSLTPKGPSIDRDTAREAVRRDADLQYALHQPDYFQKLEFAGVVDFEGHSCYWLHGTTKWGKDNNQFYDVQTGLLVGYRFQSDDSSSGMNIALFQDYKNFGGPLIATKRISRDGSGVQTLTFTSVTYEALADSVFAMPPAVRALLK